MIHGLRFGFLQKITQSSQQLFTFFFAQIKYWLDCCFTVVLNIYIYYDLSLRDGNDQSQREVSGLQQQLNNLHQEKQHIIITGGVKQVIKSGVTTSSLTGDSSSQAGI